MLFVILYKRYAFIYLIIGTHIIRHLIYLYRYGIYTYIICSLLKLLYNFKYVDIMFKNILSVSIIILIIIFYIR